MRINNATGAAEALPDVLSDVKFSSTGWTPDDKACVPRRLQIPDIRTHFLADPTVADQLARSDAKLELNERVAQQ